MDTLVLPSNSILDHHGRSDVRYRMRVTGIYPDPLDRRCQEKVQI